MLGYDSINFLVGLGSILLFAGLQIIIVLISSAMLVCRANCPCRFLRKTFSAEVVWYSSLTFLHGTFFEISVCVCTSLSMIPHWSFLSKSDHLSIGSAILFLAILITYWGFSAHFALCKSRKLANLNQAEVEERNIKRSAYEHERILGELLLKRGSDSELEKS